METNRERKGDTQMIIRSKLQLFRMLSDILAVGANMDTLQKTLDVIVAFFEAQEGGILGCESEVLGQPQYTFLVTTPGVPRENVWRINEHKIFRAEHQKVCFYHAIHGQYEKLLAKVPIRYKSEEKGLLLLQWDVDKKLKENDEELLETIGNFIGVAIYQTELFTSLQKREEELQYVCQGILNIKEEEGRRLSRELHDEIGQNLTSMLLYIKLLQKEEMEDSVRQKLDGLRVLVSQTLTDAQRISMNLRPTVLDELGLLPSLRWYVEEYRKKQPEMEISFAAPAKLTGLSTDQELAVYRAVIEALTNISRHANAKMAEIGICMVEEDLYIWVADDGIGMDMKNQKSGLGILGMRERLRAVGAELTIKSKPGKGTRVEITMRKEKTDEDIIGG